VKQTWKSIVPMSFTEKEKELLAKYYPDAYKIAYSFKAPQIGDDVRENIAFNALQRSVKSFDDTKKTKFTTFLYLCIYNSLKSEVQRQHRLPYHIAQVHDHHTSEWMSILPLLPEKIYKGQEDKEHYDQFVKRLKERLNTRRTEILEMLMNPDTHLAEYGKTVQVHRIPKRLTYTIIAKKIGKSVSKVSFEIKVIREQAKQVLKELE